MSRRFLTALLISAILHLAAFLPSGGLSARKMSGGEQVLTVDLAPPAAPLSRTPPATEQATETRPSIQPEARQTLSTSGSPSSRQSPARPSSTTANDAHDQAGADANDLVRLRIGLATAMQTLDPSPLPPGPPGRSRWRLSWNAKGELTALRLIADSGSPERDKALLARLLESSRHINLPGSLRGRDFSMELVFEFAGK